jgi:hypothetical protein
MERSPENHPYEQRGEMKPRDKKEVNEDTARKLGNTAVKGAGNKK